MTRTFGEAPSAADMERMARKALDRLPGQFAEHLRDVVLQVDDFADEETLREVGLEEPYDLTGIYQGLPLGEKSIGHSGQMPDRIFLYRMPILLEWCERCDETLEHLVAHVVVHEVGHHFGLSDEDMHALEDDVAN